MTSPETDVTEGRQAERRMGNLRARAIKGTAWYTGAQFCAKLVSWAVTILLARWLSPADYGLFAMGLAVIAFLELFQEVGLGSAIIQRQTLSRQQLNGFAWIVLGLSLVVTAVGFGAADAAAWYYRDPRLVAVVRVLSLTFLLHAIGLVPFSLLTKELDFRRRSVAEVLGSTTSAGVALWLAYRGDGVWALVMGSLVAAAVRTGMVVALCRWLPGLDVSFAGIRQVMSFGLNVTGRNAVRTLSQVVNTAIVGRLLGGHALGIYSMAHSLGMNPLHKLSTAVIHQMSLPVFAKLQAEDDQLRRAYLKIAKYLAIIAFPGQLGLALIAPDLIVVLLTEKWAATRGLIEVFCVGGLCYVLSLPSTSVLTARERAGLVLRTYLVSSVVVALALLVASPFGLPGVALAYLATFPALRLFLLWLGLREIRLPIARYVETVGPALLATVAMGVTVLVLRTVVLGHLAHAERLGICVAAGAAIYVAALLLGDRHFGAEVKGIVRTLFGPSPVGKERAEREA